MNPSSFAPKIIVGLLSVWVMTIGVIVSKAEGPASDATLLERAYHYDAGIGGLRDASKAAAFYQQAADGNDGIAQVRLGYLYETGDGVPQDYVRARGLYEAAVANGVVEGRLRLALCYLEGWGGAVNREGFVRELKIAAEADYVSAQRVLAGVYFWGIAVPVDRAAGLAWMERAAKLDDPISQYDIGTVLASPTDLIHRTDKEVVRGWFALSAEQEYTAAMNAMAQSFLRKEDGQDDWQMAKQWLLLADESGDPEAPYNLGICAALKPDIPPEDRARAREWLERAASRGNQRARDVLDFADRGRTIQQAARHALDTPYDQRYIQRLAAREAALPADGNVQPRPIRLARPVYPMSLRLSGTEGDAIIEFVIDTTGQVRNAKVVRADHPLFGERALETVSTWRFKPGRKAGRLVNTRMQVPIYFRLTHQDFDGVEEYMQFARSRAQSMGAQVVEDTRILEIARPMGKRMSAPLMPDGQQPPDDARGLVVLVLDASGRVQRSHIIDVTPKVLGPIMQASLREQQFEPVRVDGTPTEGSVLVIYYQRQLLRNNKPTL